MPKTADRVQETTTTTGTGTITLAGAVTGYRTFTASFSNADVVFYTIDDLAGNWEVGLGTFTASGTTLSRTTVLASSNSGSLVNFGAGTKRVYSTAPTRAVLPDQTSNSGKFLTTDATSPSWATITQMTYPGAGIAVSTGSAWTTSLTAPSGTIVGTTDTQTLSAKTLTLPKINDTSANNTYTFAVSELAADRTVTLPLLTGNDTFVFADFTQTLANKTLTLPKINDTSANNTYTFAVSELAADRTITLPLLTGNDVFVFADFAQTLTNKTISADSNNISGLAASSFVLSNASGYIDGAASQKVIPSGAVVGTTDSQTLSSKTLTDPAITGCIMEDVYAISDGAGFEIDPGNGSIQTITLGASRTPKATNFAAGEAVILMIDDGTAYTITWTDATLNPTWLTSSGAAPTLATTGYTAVTLWKVGSVIYGKY